MFWIGKMQFIEEGVELNTLAERLLYTRQARKVTQKQIQTNTGISQSSYSDLEGGKRLNSSYLFNIAKYLKVDLDWLLNGVSSNPKEIDVDDVVVQNANVVLAPVVVLTILNTNSSKSLAKIGLLELVSMTTVAQYPFSDEFIKNAELDCNQLKVMQCNFDHLEGFIDLGDYFAFSTITKDKEIKHGAYYVVVFSGEILFCQIFKQGKSSFKLHCTNNKYFDIDITDEMFEEFRVIGRICWKSSTI